MPLPSIQTSPFISFANATENRRLTTRDLKPPQFARVAGFYVDSSDHLLTTPIPAFSFPAAAVIPSAPARTRISDLDDIFTLAASGWGYDAGSADVSITGGGGSNADLSLVVNGSGAIQTFVVSNYGTSYTSQPAVSLTGGFGGSITVRNWALTGYTAFIEIGGYVVLLKAENTSRKIRWCAPGRSSMWDRYELDGDIDVLTGADYTTLKGSGDLEQGLVLGSLGVLFDANGIGVLAQTGDWEAPFAYAKTLNETTAESQVRELNGKGYFVGYDGQIWQTTGYAMAPLGGPLDMNQITEITWPPASPIQFAFNSATQQWVIYDTTTYVYVDKETGAYTTSGSTKYIQTGVIPGLAPESDRVHVQRVRVLNKISGTFTGNCTVQVSIKPATSTTWHDSGAVDIGTAATAGTYETEVEVNYSCVLPELKFTYTTASGATLKPLGCTLLYSTGGLR